MALSIRYWANYTDGMVKLQRRSENAVASDHVLLFTFDKDAMHVRAVVQASMRDQSYKVDVDLDASYGVADSRCQCAQQNFYCHHVAAALLFGYKCASKTDIKCGWTKKPKSSIKRETKTIMDLFPPSKPEYRALAKPVNDEDRKFMYDELCKLGRFTALQWLLSPEPEKVPPPAPIVEDLLINPEFLISEMPMVWLRMKLVMSRENIIKTAKATIGQRTNPLWSIIRKYRLTASNFGAVLSAKRLTKTLKQKLVSSCNLGSVCAVAWGINHEETALEHYKSLGAEVQDAGLFLHESGVLGASPDGVVLSPPPQQGKVHFQMSYRSLQPEILEIKCPYSARDITVCEAVLAVKDFYLEQKNDTLQLKTTHPYYHQVQGQMYVTGAKACDFVVWTPKETVIIRVEKDKLWAQNIAKLVEFYYTVFIPELNA